MVKPCHVNGSNQFSTHSFIPVVQTWKNKIKFLESLMNSFQRAYYPSQNVSIDEMVIGFRGRWKNRQFNTSNPSKHHIKTFSLESLTEEFTRWGPVVKIRVGSECVHRFSIILVSAGFKYGFKHCSGYCWSQKVPLFNACCNKNKTV